MAFDKFFKHKLKESVDIFQELNNCPSHVIGLFKNLLPPEFQSKLKYPDYLPDLQGMSLDNGLEELIRFLTTVKNDHDDEGNTLLHLAAKYEDKPMIHFLLSNENVNMHLAKNNEGKLPSDNSSDMIFKAMIECSN